MTAAIDLRDSLPESEVTREQILRGLRGRPKALPCKLFYDARGSELFERICELEEYYLTRVETGILRDCSGELAALIGPGSTVLEFGSGLSLKTRILLDALEEPADGTPDGSRAVRAVRRVLADVGFPTLAETGVAEEALPALVASATGEQSYNLEIDCHAWSSAEIEQAFRAALALESR